MLSYQVYVLNKIFYESLETFSTAEQSIGGIDDANAINTLAQLAKQLNLSDEQKKQAQANKVALKQKMKELNKNESITVKEQRDRKDALRKEQKAKMQALLTPEQKTKMAELKATKMAKKEDKFAKGLEKMKSKMLLQVHDELVFDALITEAKEFGYSFEVSNKLIQLILKSEIVNSILDWIQQKKSAEESKLQRDLNKKLDKIKVEKLIDAKGKADSLLDEAQKILHDANLYKHTWFSQKSINSISSESKKKLINSKSIKFIPIIKEINDDINPIIKYSCNHKYEIFSRSANEMLIRTTDGNTEFDWWFILVPVETE